MCIIVCEFINVCFLPQCHFWRILNTPTSSRCMTSFTRRNPSHWYLSIWWDTHTHTHTYTHTVLIIWCIDPLKHFVCISGQGSETVSWRLWKHNPCSQRQSENNIHVSVTAWHLLLTCSCSLHKNKKNQWILLHLHFWNLCLSTSCHFSVTCGFSLPSSFFSSCCVVCHTVIGEKFSIETWNHRTCWSTSEESSNWQTLVSPLPVSTWFQQTHINMEPDICHQSPDVYHYNSRVTADLVPLAEKLAVTVHPHTMIEDENESFVEESFSFCL